MNCMKKFLTLGLLISMSIALIAENSHKRKAEDLSICGNLKVQGNSKLKGHLTAKNGLTIDGQFNQNHKTYPLTKCDIERRTHFGTAQEQYDIIVVGAGTAGSLLTFRMAERYPDAKILVLDVGQDDVRTTTGYPTTPGSVVPNPNLPGDSWGQNLRSLLSVFGEGCAQWQVQIQTTTDVQDIRVPIQMARGATLGGTSSINAQIWNRGTKEGTYDRWEAALGDKSFGFTSMVEAYKKIENRTQLTKFYGKAFPYWYAAGGPTPGQSLNTNVMGTTGALYLTSTPLLGYGARAVQQAVSELPYLPGRSSILPINQADVDPANTAIEYNYTVPFSEYDQSDPNFPNINPYKPSAPDFTPIPGYTYTPPADSSNAKGPEYAGNGLILPVPLNLPKSLKARCYAAPAYLYPILDHKIPHNVTIKERVYVTQLLFNPEDSSEVIGVEYAEGQNGEGWQVSETNRAIARDVAPWKGTLSGTPAVTAARALSTAEATVKNQNQSTLKKAYAALDVWICCGAVDSPALLQRSGIASREFLETLRFLPITTNVDLPGVGFSAQDSLDMLISYYSEEDLSTGLPSPRPAAVGENALAGVLGFADPTDPFNAAGTASISGAAINAQNCILRIQSNPTKRYADTDMAYSGGGAIVSALGNVLYQDIANLLSGNPQTIDFDTIKPIFDRARWGMYAPLASGRYLWTQSFLIEYWDVISQGQVKIRSGNVYERAEYSPNMIADDLDTNAMANIFNNSIFPITQRMASKRYGPRGIATYRGIASGNTTTTINLSSSIIAVKPISGNITQAQYDMPGTLGTSPANGYSITGIDATGKTQNNLIIGWTGAQSYEATVLNPWVITPVLYTLNPATTDPSNPVTPLQSVEFNDNNHRNFVRFAFPHGDELFNSVKIVTASAAAPITFTTSKASTRVNIAQANHGFTTGDMIKIEGITSAIDTIAPEHFNDYHIVYVKDANNYDIILFWNVTPIGGPGSAPTPNPAAAAVGAETVFTVLGSVTINTLHFDQRKFQNWLLNHFFSGWHPCCTCRMGTPDDIEAVVDTRARIYDTKGARVVDASIFPVKPNCNTQAPTYGIAQKIFDLVSVEEYDKLLNN